MLAVDYESFTGRPLGLTGELAELDAARLLDLTLMPVRHPGYDATDRDGAHIQIKGRQLEPLKDGLIGTIKATDDCHAVVLVLFDQRYQPTEVLRAEYLAVDKALRQPGSRSRNERRQLPVARFRRLASQVWPG